MKINWKRKKERGLASWSGVEETLRAETPIGEVIIEKYYCGMREGWRSYYYPPADEVVESIDIEIPSHLEAEESIREFVERKVWEIVSQIREIEKDPEWVLIDKLGDAELWENNETGEEAILIRKEMRVAISRLVFPGGCFSLGNYYAEDGNLYRESESDSEPVEPVPELVPEPEEIKKAKVIRRIPPEELAERMGR